MACELRILSPAGELCSVPVAPKLTLTDLKTAIEAQTGIPAMRQRLFHDVSEIVEEDVAQVLPKDEEVIYVLLIQRSTEQANWLQSVNFGPPFWFMAHAPAEARKDREVALAAVSHHAPMLQYAAEELKGDRDVVLRAVRKTGAALQYASPDVQADLEVALAAVTTTGRALRFVAEDLRSDAEVVRAAVRQDGCALEFASEELRGDRGVVLEAVSQNGMSLAFATEDLREDREVVCAAVKEDKRALQYVAADLRVDTAVLKVAGQGIDTGCTNPFALKVPWLGARLVERVAGLTALLTA